MRILVAMSGGVDSSVAAAKLIDEGHDVVGATLRLWGGESDSGCCSVSDVDDARRVCQVLGIDHHVFNYADEFEAAVVTPYVAAHRAGRTPNPCVECNRHIKFDLLAQRAERLGFERLATGHYARVVERDGVSRLARGVDPTKDQSYVLAFLEGAALARLTLPIGRLEKGEVRERAHELGLRTWDKPDSQDVCFIPSTGGRVRFLERRMAFTPARVVDRVSGDEVGTVEAAELMTVGQRRGVSPGRDGARRYVARVDLTNHLVEVDVLEGVVSDRVVLEDGTMHFLHRTLEDGQRVVAQFSAHGRPAPGTLRRGATTWISLDEPVRPVAPGQVAVLYNADDPDLVEGAALVGAP